jgi:1-deoxy-D-xylulose-5-phosphate reductoisomerase
MIGLTILGSTGSIGINTLKVVESYPERFRIIALTAHHNAEVLYAQCLRYQPRYAVLANMDAAQKLQQRLRAAHSPTEVLAGADDLARVAGLDEADYVMAAIVGAAGLLPTLAAVRAGKRVLLANKEALVVMGALFIEEVRSQQAVLLPVDSEHNAIFQCLPTDFKPGIDVAAVEKILLTASGGPFRQTPLAQLAQVTPEQAYTHPIWNMGRKISVDSATLMNKGLEVIEAHWLFGLPLSKIEVLLHPQSIVHSLVEYRDGSLLAQLGQPDMRTPIAHALAWPERIQSGVARLDLTQTGRLDFAAIDLERYPCLGLAYQALTAGGTATAILNAANEVAVQAFLDKQVAFTDIFAIIADVLQRVASHPADNLEVILADDRQAREIAQGLVAKQNNIVVSFPPL